MDQSISKDPIDELCDLVNDNIGTAFKKYNSIISNHSNPKPRLKLDINFLQNQNEKYFYMDDNNKIKDKCELEKFINKDYKDKEKEHYVYYVKDISLLNNEKCPAEVWITFVIRYDSDLGCYIMKNFDIHPKKNFPKITEVADYKPFCEIIKKTEIKVKIVNYKYNEEVYESPPNNNNKNKRKRMEVVLEQNKVTDKSIYSLLYSNYIGKDFIYRLYHSTLMGFIYTINEYIIIEDPYYISKLITLFCEDEKQKRDIQTCIHYLIVEENNNYINILDCDYYIKTKYFLVNFGDYYLSFLFTDIINYDEYIEYQLETKFKNLKQIDNSEFLHPDSTESYQLEFIQYTLSSQILTLFHSGVYCMFYKMDGIIYLWHIVKDKNNTTSYPTETLKLIKELLNKCKLEMKVNQIDKDYNSCNFSEKMKALGIYGLTNDAEENILSYKIKYLSEIIAENIDEDLFNKITVRDIKTSYDELKKTKNKINVNDILKIIYKDDNQIDSIKI